MTRRRSSTTLLLAAAAVLLAPTHRLDAQSIWHQSDDKPGIRLEIQRVLVSDPDFNLSTGTLVYGLSGSMPITPLLAVAAEIPFANASLEEPDGTKIEGSLLGNPFLGLRLTPGGADGALTAEFGARLPVVNINSNDNDFGEELASFIGTLSDIDRVEAFDDGVTSLSAAVARSARSKSGVSSKVRLGLTHNLFKEVNGIERDAETTFDYGARTGVEASVVRVDAALTGRFIMTEAGSFGSRSFHNLSFAATSTRQGVRPGLHVRLPLEDDVRQAVSFVIGLTMQASFR